MRLPAHLPAILLVACLALALDAPFLFFGKTLYLSDITYNVEPAARFMRETWQSTGTLPCWNPYILCGARQCAWQWPVFYLPGAVFLTFPFSLATGLFLFFHQLLAGICLYAWQWRQSEPDESRPWLPPLVAAVAFMSCGYMAGSSINMFLYASAAWIPAVLLAIDRMLTARNWQSCGALGLTCGMQMAAGRPELSVASVILYAFYAGGKICRASKPEHQLNKAAACRLAGLALCGLVLGALVSAADLLPMLDYLKQCPPAESSVTLGSEFWSTGWFDVLGMILSQPIGPLATSSSHLYLTEPGAGQYITSLYLGAPLLTLALLGFTWRKCPGMRFWLGVAAVSALAASGYHARDLSARALFCQAPLFRYPIKLSVIFILAICCAAAAGTRRVLCGDDRGKVIRLASLFWLICLTSSVVLLVVPRQFTILTWKYADLNEITAGDITRWMRLSLELAGAGATGLLTAWLAGRKAQTNWMAAVLIALLAGLFLANAANHLWITTGQDFFDRPSSLAAWFANRTISPNERVLSLIQDPVLTPLPVRSVPRRQLDESIMQYARQILRPNTNMDAALPLSSGVSTVPSWCGFFLNTGVLPRSTLAPYLTHPAGKSNLPLLRFCQITSSKYIICPSAVIVSRQNKPLAVPSLPKELFTLEKDCREDNLKVYSVPEIRPAACLVGSCRLTTSRNEALTLINRCDKTNYDPQKEVLITWIASQIPNSIKNQMQGCPAASIISCPSKKMSHAKIEVSVDTIRPYFLVLNESYDPQWEAFDNGRHCPVYLADGLVSAVFLPAGRHQVTFAYHPYIQEAALFFTAAGLVGSLALLLFAGKSLTSGKGNI